LGLNVLSLFRPAPDSSAAACANHVADELARSNLIRGFLPEPTTMSATSVLPSPLLRHYPVRKPAPQDLAMSRATNPSEYSCREKRYAVLRAWRLSPHLLCPSALCCTTVFFTAVLLVRKRAPQDLAMSHAAKPFEYRRSLLICFAPRLCAAMLCFNLPRAVLLLGPVHNYLRVVLRFSSLRYSLSGCPLTFWGHAPGSRFAASRSRCSLAPLLSYGYPDSLCQRVNI
jgi:hypothetical protein